MGYILPITPYHSIQYANLQRISSEHYSNVAALQRMGMQSDFAKELSRRLERYNELEKMNRRNRKASQKTNKAEPDKLMLPRNNFSNNVLQNNTKLMKEIAQVTGKGKNANYYI